MVATRATTRRPPRAARERDLDAGPGPAAGPATDARADEEHVAAVVQPLRPSQSPERAEPPATRASAAAGDEPATTNDALIVSSWVSLRARDVVLASRARGPARINLRGTIDVVTSTPSRELARARIRGRVEIPPGPSCPVKIPPPHR